MALGEHIRELWKQVFVAAIRAGGSFYDATQKADHAVDKFRERFG